jgi:hypothetical protein
MEIAETCIEGCVDVPLTQNQFDALVCFAYNAGLSALEHSTLLKLVNSGMFREAAWQFGRWDKATVDGKLVEVSGAGDAKTYGKAQEPAYQDQETFYRELLGYAMQKNFKSGWAFHQFKAKYKTNPDPFFRTEALAPTPATINYIKHLWIKKKKAEEKALGAWGR